MVFYAGIRLGIRRIQTQIRERLPTPSRDAAQRKNWNCDGLESTVEECTSPALRWEERCFHTALGGIKPQSGKSIDDATYQTHDRHDLRCDAGHVSSNMLDCLKGV